MYITSIQDIKVPFLHDAALTLSLRQNDKGENIYKLRSLYMDRSGECAISYYGRLSEQEIKEVMINYCYPYENKCYDEIHPVYIENYTYDNGHHANGESDYTTIYTPDGINYKILLT